MREISRSNSRHVAHCLNSAKHIKKPSASNSDLDPGAAANNVYLNKTLGLTCKIPEGWVLRTDEMNAREDEKDSAGSGPSSSSTGARVLLAAFSRPPEARAEDVNSFYPHRCRARDFLSRSKRRGPIFRSSRGSREKPRASRRMKNRTKLLLARKPWFVPTFTKTWARA